MMDLRFNMGFEKSRTPREMAELFALCRAIKFNRKVYQ